MSSLLAVDVGLKTGLALYDRDGRLIWYRSHNFGTIARLKRAVRNLFNNIPDLTCLVVEGGGSLADIWVNEARRRHLWAHQISAEEWRHQFLYLREQRTGPLAKQRADGFARRVIEWSDAPRPTSLRHDTAEAIMIGLWGVLAIGWLDNLPDSLKR